MPFITNNTLKVKEFRSNSNSSVIWTTKEAMETWNNFRENYYGKPIYVGYAFKRIWQGGHGNQSQHYAGVAFDVGQNLSEQERQNLYDSAVSFGGWSYVEPIEMTPTWVHFDKRQYPAACSHGYPTISQTNDYMISVYVLVLQDALNALGYRCPLDGYYFNETKNAVKDFQGDNGLTVDGIVGCNTWTKLTDLANGIGQTSTVVNP